MEDTLPGIAPIYHDPGDRFELSVWIPENPVFAPYSKEIDVNSVALGN